LDHPQLKRTALIACALAAACSKSAAPVSAAAAARFLEQATFGPSPESVAHLQALGFDAWFAEQLGAPPSGYDAPAPAENDLTTIQSRFFANAIEGKDQLRQRVAFALSQIFVVSGSRNDDPRLFFSWLRLLSADAFGSFSTLLTDVTLSPAMGEYLDMVNNSKRDPVAGTNPNENYGREVLQLFSIGLSRLNQDGSVQRGPSGAPIPAYDQFVVEGFAHVFTGWTYPTIQGATPDFPNPSAYHAAMELRPDRHDTGPKLLLRNVRLPAGQTAQQDLAAAIDNIVQDPNVGPFIGFRLIQRLVKSNPSPAYVARVAAAFANNGSGGRGDLKAVLRAVLFDPEARQQDGSSAPQPLDGKLREPVLIITGLLRSLGARSNGAGLSNYARAMNQNLFYPATVFNYYPPTYQLPGSSTYGPEFKLRTGPAMFAEESFVNDVAYGALPAGTTADLDALIKLAPDAPGLADELGARALRSSMSPELRQALVTALSALPASDTQGRVSAGIYLVGISSQFQIQP
jgi:uncharacterized protein (DUF1800 family)